MYKHNPLFVCNYSINPHFTKLSHIHSDRSLTSPHVTSSVKLTHLVMVSVKNINFNPFLLQLLISYTQHPKKVIKLVCVWYT